MPEFPTADDLNAYAGLRRREILAAGSTTGPLAGCMRTGGDTGGRDTDNGATDGPTDRQISDRHGDAGDDIADRLAAAAPGDTVLLDGEYVIGSPPVEIDKELHLRGRNGALIRLASGTLTANDAADGGNQHLLEILPGGSGGSIENVEIDGNAGNQAAFTHDEGSAYSHGIRVGGRGNETVREYRIERCYIHDTVRSSISGRMRDCRIVNNRLENSFNDHHLYLAGATDVYVGNITAAGFCRRASLVFSTSNKETVDPVVNGYVYRDVAANPHDSDPVPQVTIRDEGRTAGATITNLTVDTSGISAFGTSVSVNAPGVTGRDWNLLGHLSDHILDVGPNADRLTVDGCRVDVTSTDGSQRAAIRLSGPEGVRFSNVSLRERSGDEKLRGIAINAPTDGVSVVGLNLDIGRQWLDIDAETTRMTVNGLHDRRSLGPAIDANTGVAVEGYAEEPTSEAVSPSKYAPGTLVQVTGDGGLDDSGIYVVTKRGVTRVADSIDG